MHAAKYFPSIHDDTEDIKTWIPSMNPITTSQTPRKINLSAISSAAKSTKEKSSSCTDPRKSTTRKITVEDSAAWPDSGCLAVPDYRPLEAFAPLAGPNSTSWSKADETCEYCIGLKERELCTMIGETSDTQSCK